MYLPNPAGPGISSAAANIGRFRANPPRFLESMRQQYGDVVYFRMGHIRFYLLSDSDLIQEVLINRAGEFHKDALIRELSQLVGRGLLTSEGDFWRRQRKMAAPAMRKKRIASYADTMVDRTRALVDAFADDEVRVVNDDMMALGLQIVVKTLFNVDVSADAESVGVAMDGAMHNFQKLAQTWWRFVPRWVPASPGRKFRQTTKSLDAIVQSFIDTRRENFVEGDDLLYMLMSARDEDGKAMSEQQLRDEVITMFLAGHETTALALTYALYALTRNPDTLRKVRAELDEVLDGRPATAAEFGRLRYLNAVVQETLRLYPPAWVIGREALNDVMLGDYMIPRGSQVLVSPYAQHRDPRWWSSPEQFLPERWMEEAADRPRFAYMPFGGGPRTCIGNHFALMEIALVLATLLQQLDIELVDPENLEFSASVTMRPKSDVRIRMKKRKHAAALTPPSAAA